jgi:DMSO/TMAO reductase YedYZ molybdopterin-dependent catalytic subunit
MHSAARKNLVHFDVMYALHMLSIVDMRPRARWVLMLFLACTGVAQNHVQLSITGDVQTPLSLTAADLTAYPHQTVTVNERDGTKANYEGVPLLDVLKKAGIPTGNQLRGKAMASYVLARGHDGYEVTFALAELDPEIGPGGVVIADKRDGNALPDREGPFRLVVPSDKKGARWVRMLEELHVVMLQK